MLLLGFAAGIPYLLIFSSLSLWLSEAGVTKSAVTFFSWAALGYSFKFVWAPIIDKLPIPFLSASLGRRRSWLLLSQLAVMVAISWMATTNPQANLSTMAMAAVFLGFASATQDIVVDALRIELADTRLQAMLSSTYVAGYRVALLLSGAGVLYLAQWFGSTSGDYNYEAWRNAYLCMVLMMLVGIVTTLVIAEPPSQGNKAYPYPARDYGQFFLLFLVSVAALIGVFLLTPDAPEISTGYSQQVFQFFYSTAVLALALGAACLTALTGLRLKLINPDMVYENYQAPWLNFFQRYRQLALWVLLLIGFYRIADIVMGVIANVFYQDIGYSKAEIASVTKIFGVLMTIAGTFLGGLLVLRIGVFKMLMTGAILIAATNLLFMALAQSEPNITWLSAVIAADNLSQGLAIAAFIAWLSSLTHVSFTATQYAIFSSLMTLFPKLISGYSGTAVEAIGYANFFLMTALLGVPVIFMVYFLRSRLEATAENRQPNVSAP